jgi:type IV fimbrial biogenesis protein FimT
MQCPVKSRLNIERRHRSSLNASVHRTRGASVVEALLCLSVIAVVLGTALPSFDSQRQRRQLEGAAAQLETDIAYTRSLAVMQNRTLRMGYTSAGAAGSCYVVYAGPPQSCTCDAQGQTQCQVGGQDLRTVHFPAGGVVRLAANVRSMAFSPGLGTVTPTATLRVLASNELALHQVVNVMGRVRTCTPSAALPGYRRC